MSGCGVPKVDTVEDGLEERWRACVEPVLW